MNKLLILFGFILAACNSAHTQSDTRKNILYEDARSTATDSIDVFTITRNDKLGGDFNGDGKIDSAWIDLLKGVKPDQFAVFFSDTSIPVLNIQCCEAVLIKEGDLNFDKKTDFSVYQILKDHETSFHAFWVMKDNKWTPFTSPVIGPLAERKVSRASLENSVMVSYHY